jgi:hypothetical protein
MRKKEVFKKYTGIFAISVNNVVGWDLYEKSSINAEYHFQMRYTDLD